MAEYIPDFKTKLQNAIDHYTAEAVRLAKWRDDLDAEGFDWNKITEPQAWVIWKYSCAGKAEKEAHADHLDSFHEAEKEAQR